MAELTAEPLDAPARAGSILSSWRFRRTAVACLQHAILLSVVGLIMLPLVWTLSTSLKEASQVYGFPPALIPKPIRLQNYPEAMTVGPWLRFFTNSSLVTGLNILGQIVACSLVGFSFARLRWWGRDVLFILMIATMMLPHQVTLVPQFVLFRTLGWVSTLLPLIVPRFFAAAFYTFLVRQFFMTIPTDLDDAARIDGASTFGIYSRIILPMSKPVLMAVAIFVFTASWNEFQLPLIYLHSEQNFTIQLGLRGYQSLHGGQWHLLMAASTLTMLPVIILFFLGQRYFIQGVVFSGIKG
ncbi:MAG: carbohydrate ABC transporter permease [Chloroflexi bacterium]|nr:carbohydrate ABC transporter permease [Chloroflexota bacterium]